MNPSGNGRDVLVTSGGEFHLLDMGTWAQAHGDHFHYFTDTPALTDVAYKAQTPGHVVAHAGRTVLFDDGTGTAQIIPTDQIAEAGITPETYTAASAHHGVAVVLADDTLLVSDGDSDTRKGALAFDEHRDQIAATEECPGIHGEAVAKDEIATFGCKDGAVIYHNGAFEKIASPDQARGTSSLFGTEESSVVLGNYSAASEGTLSTEIALIDTATEAFSVVDLGSAYSFRSFARGDSGEAIILTADGKLHVLDPASGTEIGAYPILNAWEVPSEWQAPRPSVFVADGNAYVTDPAAKKLYVVDIQTGEVWSEVSLPQEVNEITGVTGYATSVAADEAEHDHGHGDGHDHEEGHSH